LFEMMIRNGDSAVYTRKVVLCGSDMRVYTVRMSGYVKQRARDRIATLAGRCLDLATFWREANEALVPAVPHYMGLCWYTLDPVSLLVTSHFNTHMPELPPEMFAHEYYEDDFHKIADVARSEHGISTLHEVTGGDPSRSPGWNRFVRPYGGDQELLVALRTQAGQAWGMLGVYREVGQPMFDAEECRLLREVAPYLAEGAQRGLLVGEASDPEGPETPGLVILRENWSVESLTPGVARWLDELPDGDWEASGKLPPAVLSVAGRALRTAEHADTPGEVALARVLTRTGRWIVLHGAALVASGARRVAVIIEPAHPARITSLLMAAYGLTEREQEVTRLVLQGNSTAEIAERLVVSAHTVQQHLKSVFEKTGVHSRRELVGKVFFAYYEPRVSDNEQRAVVGQPLRGGPLERRTND
jgi:DNA-binding CsgD family transcriptional regulator